MKARFLQLACVILLIAFAASACSNESKSEKRPRIKEPSQLSQSTEKAPLSKTDFNLKVQNVCSSVDSNIFKEVLTLQPEKDPEFEQKFKAAIEALDSLKKDFKALEPPTDKKTEWDGALKNLGDLRDQVAIVLEQYKEYVGLLDESKVNKDPQRSIQIISRLITLGQEYVATVDKVSKQFDEMLKMGSAAGVTSCSAFQIA